jgi:hypothetical protein
MHDLGAKVVGRRDGDEIVRLGRSVAQVAVDFFEGAHQAMRVANHRGTEEIRT